MWCAATEGTSAKFELNVSWLGSWYRSTNRLDKPAKFVLSQKCEGALVTSLVGVRYGKESLAGGTGDYVRVLAGSALLCQDA